MMLSFTFTHAQVAADTLSIAKKLKDKDQLKEAFALLSDFQKNHPDNLNAIWLSAQVAFWMHHIKTSEMLYEKAITANPKNYYLKLDFAKMLANAGEFDSALSLLNIYLAYDPTNADAWLTITKIYYWQGNYNKAFTMAENIVKHNPNNKDAIDLLNDIMGAKSPWIKLNADYNSDDQPLKSIAPSIEAGVFLHPLANLHFSGSAPFFIQNDSASHAFIFQAGIKSDFNKEEIVTDISAGIANFPYKNSVAFIGGIAFEKTFIQHLLLTAQATRSPYFYSLSSIDTELVDNNYTASIAWKNQFTINGNAGYSINQFADGNIVSTFYAGIFSPLFKKQKLDFQFGYGYNYSNAKQNEFEPKQTLAEIISSPGSNIAGIYNPYFTPDDQQIHSVIITADYHPTKKITMGASANYGFYATTQDPYFSLITQGTSITGVSKSYAQQKFSPVQAGYYILYQLSKKTILKASYQYHQTFFYTNNYVGISLKTSFWNEKKKE